MTDAEYEKMKEIVNTVERLNLRRRNIDAVLAGKWERPGYNVPTSIQEIHDDMLRRGADVMRQGIAESIAAIQFSTENAASTSPQSGGVRKMVISEETSDEARVLPSE